MVLGVDVGGSRSRYVLFSEGKVVRSGELEWRYGESLLSLAEEISRLRESLGATKVGVAMKGVWEGEEKEEVGRLLKVDLVLSDVEGVFYDAFKDEGMVLVAGTGSICYGRKGGKEARSGGFGPLVDDWGSAFWMGRLACEIALKKESFLRLALFGEDNLMGIRKTLSELQKRGFADMVREIAGYSYTVLRVAYELRDEDALFVVRAAIRELTALCLSVLEEIGHPGAIALHGGLFSYTPFREDFTRLIKRYAFKRVVHDTNAARGVAKRLTF